MFPKAPVRLALLGAGQFAKTAHFSVLSELQERGFVQIQLIWSRRKLPAAELASRYGGSSAIAYDTSIDQAEDGNDQSDLERKQRQDSVLTSARNALLAHRERVDAVVICVPILQNADFTRLALSLRFHVLCEKPLAHDAAAARSLLEDVPRGVLHAVGENYRHERVFFEAPSKINETCGELIALRLTVQTPMRASSPNCKGWRLELPTAGLLTDGFVHHVAALRMLADSDVVNVSARCFNRSVAFGVCDTAITCLTFENGLCADCFVTSAGGIFLWEVVVVGHLGDVTIRRLSGRPGYQILCQDRSGGNSDRIYQFSGLEQEMMSFVHACRTGKLPDKLSARKAFNDIATVSAMFQSSSENRAVDVPQIEPATICNLELLKYIE